MYILGIETSCDETGVAIYGERGLLSHCLHSQIKTHEIHGGVVPELASRDHIKHLVPLVEKSLNDAGILKSELTSVAYTAGPGLIGALLSGACFAKSFAYGLGIQALAIHHLEAHILAAMMAEPVAFPFLVLLVSGGHTQLIEARALGDYVLLGDTLDDAVGEAFDKTAKCMGIPYPGGPKLAKLADSFSIDKHAPLPSKFPRPMTKNPGLDFSFSGLKTHALVNFNNSDKTEAAKIAIARAFQDAVIDTLVIKCKRALLTTNLKNLVVAGGVSANLQLRQALFGLMHELDGKVYFPELKYCTDNGAMVAFAGFMHSTNNRKDNTLAVKVKPRWPLHSCQSI